MKKTKLLLYDFLVERKTAPPQKKKKKKIAYASPSQLF